MNKSKSLELLSLEKLLKSQVDSILKTSRPRPDQRDWSVRSEAVPTSNNNNNNSETRRTVFQFSQDNAPLLSITDVDLALQKFRHHIIQISLDLKSSRLVVEWSQVSLPEKFDFTPWVKRLRTTLPDAETKSWTVNATEQLTGWDENETDSTQSFQAFASSKMKEFEQNIKQHLSVSTAELVDMDKDCSAIDRSLFSSVLKWIAKMYDSSPSKFTFHLRKVDATPEHPTTYWICHIGNLDCHLQSVLRNFVREFGVRLIDLNVDFNQQRLETIWVDSSVLNPFLWEASVNLEGSEETRLKRGSVETKLERDQPQDSGFFGGIYRKIKHRFSKRYNPMG